MTEETTPDVLTSKFKTVQMKISFKRKQLLYTHGNDQ